MKYIDIHSHLNFAIFENDLEEVVTRMRAEDLFCINIGTTEETSKRAVELADKYDNMYAIVGLHPIKVNPSYHDADEDGEKNSNTTGCEDFDEAVYEKLIQNKKVVGIGECGLDYYHANHEGKGNPNFENEVERQKINFEKQIQFAIKNDLPIMIHCRDAYDDVLTILKKFKLEASEKLRGDVHFYAGNIDQAQQFLDLDFNISFTGVITFAKQYEELVKFVPIDRIHAETDCPYVAPAPFRGKRNEPVYSIEVVKKIADMKGLPLETVTEQLILNAKKLFKI